MRSAERRFTWALIAGAIATGIGAGHTDAPVYNILVGLAWGVPVWIAAWCLLELLYYLQESRDATGRIPAERKRGDNVYVIGRETGGER